MCAFESGERGDRPVTAGRSSPAVRTGADRSGEEIVGKRRSYSNPADAVGRVVPRIRSDRRCRQTAAADRRKRCVTVADTDARRSLRAGCSGLSLCPTGKVCQPHNPDASAVAIGNVTPRQLLDCPEQAVESAAVCSSCAGDVQCASVAATNDGGLRRDHWRPSIPAWGVPKKPHLASEAAVHSAQCRPAANRCGRGRTKSSWETQFR